MTSSLASVVKVSSSQTFTESEEASVAVEGRQRELGPGDCGTCLWCPSPGQSCLVFRMETKDRRGENKDEHWLV